MRSRTCADRPSASARSCHWSRNDTASRRCSRILTYPRSTFSCGSAASIDVAATEVSYADWIACMRTCACSASSAVKVERAVAREAAEQGQRRVERPRRPAERVGGLREEREGPVASRTDVEQAVLHPLGLLGEPQAVPARDLAAHAVLEHRAEPEQVARLARE